MAFLGTRRGVSTTQDQYGQSSSSYDPGAALQQQLAQEQWDWQKQIYGAQAKAARQGAAGLTGMIGQYNQAYGAAKDANERRYQEMLGITDQTTGQRMADIRRDYEGQSADAMQQLSRLGLANTTIAPTMKMGVEREKQASLNRAADALQGTKLGIMERRTDEYPKSDIILQLAQMLGQGGGGAGVGGIVNALSNMRLG